MAQVWSILDLTIPINWEIFANVLGNQSASTKWMTKDKEIKENAAQGKDVASIGSVMKRATEAFFFIFGEKLKELWCHPVFCPFNAAS